jgi:hypothetical protein
MPIDPPIAQSSQEVVLSEHRQLLIGCLLLGLLFCSAIVVYTNQVKGKAVLLAQDSYAGDSAADTIASATGTRPSFAQETARIDRSPGLDSSLNAERNKQSSIAVSHRAAVDRKGGEELASQRAALSKQVLRRPIPTLMANGGSANPGLFRSRPRNNLPRHRKGTLIALWRQTLKRHQNDKLSHLTFKAST